MDRVIVYPGAIPQDTDVLWTNRRAMIAIGYALQAAFGTGTLVDGLACTPTSPATLTVNVGLGSIISLEEVDPNAYGSLSADTNPLVKMGINGEASTPFTLTAPGTSGQSINYLIEASFEEADTGLTVLPYYNAANPSQPYSGPGNTGQSQNTEVQESVQLQLKAGAAAPTGSQTTPTVDNGWVGLWVITVNFGQTQITASSIFQYPNAPFINAKIPQLRQRLTAATNYYVSTSGNDATGNGSQFAPWATLQGAINWLAQNIDTQGFIVTINLEAGTFTAGVSISGALVGQFGPTELVFNGAGSGSTTIALGNTSTEIFTAQNGACFTVQNMTLTGSAIQIFSVVGSEISIGAGMVFGTLTNSVTTPTHMQALEAGVIAIQASYTISGGGGAHWYVGGGGQIQINDVPITITLTGTPAFSDAFAVALTGGGIGVPSADTTFSGSATGDRYATSTAGGVDTNGGGATYLPGNAAGTATSPGYYV